jgi:hypothetical protein
MASKSCDHNAHKSAKLVFDKQVHPNICSLTLMLTDLHQLLDLLLQERWWGERERERESRVETIYLWAPHVWVPLWTWSYRWMKKSRRGHWSCPSSIIVCLHMYTNSYTNQSTRSIKKQCSAFSFYITWNWDQSGYAVGGLVGVLCSFWNK